MREVIRHIKRFFDPYIETSYRDWLHLDGYLKVENIKKRKIIKHPDSPETSLRYILKGGGVKLYKLDDKVICLDIFLEHEFFTDLQSLNNGKPNNVYLKTFEDMKVVSIDKESLFKLYSKSGTWSQIGRILAEQNVDKVHQLHLNQKGTATERIDRLLNDRPELLLRTPQIYLASFLGISPESLSRLRRRR